MLAAHAAAAILASREGEELQSALSTRDRIGQAKGIIMERYNVDDMRAFEMLRKLSQDSNTRLVDIAARVIDTRGDGEIAVTTDSAMTSPSRGTTSTGTGAWRMILAARDPRNTRATGPTHSIR